jgi:hypothetical protein
LIHDFNIELLIDMQANVVRRALWLSLELKPWNSQKKRIKTMKVRYLLGLGICSSPWKILTMTRSHVYLLGYLHQCSVEMMVVLGNVSRMFHDPHDCVGNCIKKTSWLQPIGQVCSGTLWCLLWFLHFLLIRGVVVLIFG